MPTYIRLTDYKSSDEKEFFIVNLKNITPNCKNLAVTF